MTGAARRSRPTGGSRELHPVPHPRSDAAVIAKLILKRKHGWIVTILLGLAGAALGGFIGGQVTGEDIYGVNGFFSIVSWLYAIGGAIIVLFVFGLITRKRTTS